MARCDPPTPDGFGAHGQRGRRGVGRARSPNGPRPAGSESRPYPPADCLLPPASCLLPPADCRLPTADCRLPTAECRMPNAACRLPTADCRLPTAPLIVQAVGCRLAGVDLDAAHDARVTQVAGADAAALAGARILFEGGDVASARSAAQEYADANGYVTSGSTSVSVHIPPASGAHAMTIRQTRSNRSRQCRP